jgi:hypothetical protein
VIGYALWLGYIAADPACAFRKLDGAVEGQVSIWEQGCAAGLGPQLKVKQAHL